MDRFWMRTVVGCLSASAIGILSSACAHDDSTLFIQGVLAPPATKTAGVCTYTTSPTGPFQSSGAFDIGLGGTYGGVIQVGNQLLQRGPAGPGSDPVHTETSRVVINGGEISVADATGNQIGNFTSVATSFADVGQGGTAGLGAVGLTLIDAKTANSLCDQFPTPQARKQLIVTIKAFGKTLGGTDVETQEFTYPITVCKGCLVTHDSTIPCVPIPGATATADATTDPCVVGVDTGIACSRCNGSHPDVCVDDPLKTPASADKFAKACAARLQ